MVTGKDRQFSGELAGDCLFSCKRNGYSHKGLRVVAGKEVNIWTTE